MTSTLTPAEFMSRHEPADEHDDADTAEVDHQQGQPQPNGDPLSSIAHSLDRMLAIAEHHALEESEADRFREAHDDLDAKHAVLYDLVEEIAAIVKPSTSKLANQVREAIARWSDPQIPPADQPAEPTTAAELPNPVPVSPPDRDADVSEWRDFARSRGYQGPGDLEQMNRSQIRTALGIEQVQPADQSGVNATT